MTTEDIVQRDDTETHDDVIQSDTVQNDTATEETSASSANETEEKEPTVEELKEQLRISEEKRDKLYARLKRQDKDDDGSEKTRQTAKKDEASQPASLTRDEAIVIAKGFSEEELEHAKKVAVLENCTPVQALDNDLFKDWKAKRDKVAKEQAAQLPASKGARATVKKSLSTPGLSDEEHKQLAKEKLGR